MEWLEGCSVRQTEQLDSMGLDRAQLAETLLRCGLEQMLVHGHFHADLHPGNVMVLSDGRLGLIDFGAVGRLDPLQQSSLRQLLLAVHQQDPALLRQAVLEVGTIRRGFDDEQLDRALARFMARHLGPGATPSAAMLNELLQLFFSFGIALPPEFSTFFRALMTLEGTVTTLQPGYLVIDAARAMAAEWAREQLLPMAFEDLARSELVKLAPVLRRLPRHVDRIASIVERGDLTARVSLFGDADDVRVITRLINRGARVPGGGRRAHLGDAARHPGRARVHGRDHALRVLRLLRAVLRHRADHARAGGHPARRAQLTPAVTIAATVSGPGGDVDR